MNESKKHTGNNNLMVLLLFLLFFLCYQLCRDLATLYAKRFTAYLENYLCKIFANCTKHNSGTCVCVTVN